MTEEREKERNRDRQTASCIGQRGRDGVRNVIAVQYLWCICSLLHDERIQKTLNVLLGVDIMTPEAAAGRARQQQEEEFSAPPPSASHPQEEKKPEEKKAEEKQADNDEDPAYQVGGPFQCHVEIIYIACA